MCFGLEKTHLVTRNAFSKTNLKNLHDIPDLILVYKNRLEWCRKNVKNFTSYDQNWENQERAAIILARNSIIHFAKLPVSTKNFFNNDPQKEMNIFSSLVYGGDLLYLLIYRLGNFIVIKIFLN